MVPLIDKKGLVLKQGNSLYLLLLRPTDVSQEYVDWLNNPEINKFTEQRFVKHDLRSVQSFVEEKLYDEAQYLFGIFYFGKHIGNVKIGPINSRHLIASVSYFIGARENWGNGVATRAVSRVVKFAFEDLMLEKITAGIYEPNIGSRRVLEKCGFVREAERPESAILDGKRINNLEFGLLKSQYESALFDLSSKTKSGPLK
jgi:ribosomal-protein-alanine N-acetyltransferase